MTQPDFWPAVGVTQSGGSRYESGRDMPEPLQILLNLALRPEDEAMEVLRQLRAGLEPKVPE